MKNDSILYRVVAYRTATTCRILDVRHLRNEPMYFGPWKKMRSAKKAATGLRKHRCVASIDGAPYQDYGPSFCNVKIEQVVK